MCWTAVTWCLHATSKIAPWSNSDSLALRLQRWARYTKKPAMVSKRIQAEDLKICLNKDLDRPGSQVDDISNFASCFPCCSLGWLIFSSPTNWSQDSKRCVPFGTWQWRKWPLLEPSSVWPWKHLWQSQAISLPEWLRSKRPGSSSSWGLRRGGPGNDLFKQNEHHEYADIPDLSIFHRSLRRSKMRLFAFNFNFDSEDRPCPLPSIPIKVVEMSWCRLKAQQKAMSFSSRVDPETDQPEGNGMGGGACTHGFHRSKRRSTGWHKANLGRSFNDFVLPMFFRKMCNLPINSDTPSWPDHCWTPANSHLRCIHIEGHHLHKKKLRKNWRTPKSIKVYQSCIVQTQKVCNFSFQFPGLLYLSSRCYSWPHNDLRFAGPCSHLQWWAPLCLECPSGTHPEGTRVWCPES